MDPTNILSAESPTTSEMLRMGLAQLLLRMYRKCKPLDMGGPDETIRGLSSLIAAQNKRIAELEAELAKLKAQ
jgi:hypothetical protein